MSTVAETQESSEPLVGPSDDGDTGYGSYSAQDTTGQPAKNPRQSTVDDVMDEDEQMKVMAAKILSSSGYYALCLIMIAVSTFLIIWMAVGDTDSHWWFVLLEVLVTLVIVIEVIVQMVADQREFWHNGWNVLDFIVMLLCVGSFVIYVFVRDRRQAGDDSAALIVLVIRYIAQGLRVVALMSRANQIRARAEAQDMKVDFDAVNTAEEAEDGLLESGLSKTAQFEEPGSSRATDPIDDDGVTHD